MRRLLTAACLFFGAVLPATAQQDDERAKKLFSELRCVVCQNQSIASSEAGVARDLRQLVREQIAAGKSDAEILDFLVERYGEFVLLKPRLSPHTIILWLSPIMVGLFGLFLILKMRASPAKAVAPMTPEEEARLKRLLDSASGPKDEL